MRAARLLPGILLGFLFLIGGGMALAAATVSVPNASFELPLVPQEQPYAGPDMDSWQKSPQPGWYDPAQNFDTPWDYLMGTFYNVASPSTFIDNCDGSQAAFLFALPEAAIFQDYDTIGGTNTMPSHAFNALYNIGSSYRLTVGLIGGGGGMAPGVTAQISLYYRNASSNIITVASTTVTNTPDLFPTNTHFVDFAVQLPAVQPTDPWAGGHIGVQIASTVGFDQPGGYWDVDNVRLEETAEPVLINPQLTPFGFRLTVVSVPGLKFEMLAATNASLPLSNWTGLGNITNSSGATDFLDPTAGLDRRFYRARQLP